MNRFLLFCLFLMLPLTYSTFSLTYEVVRVDRCRFVGYSPEKRQTDHDPFSTASGTQPKWGTVAANHLPLWTRIKIESFREKIFVVEDRMHSRYKRTIDVWFPSKKEACKFGVRYLKYWVLKNVSPLPK